MSSLETLTPESIPEDVIRERAYELYEKRGPQNGKAEDDWLQAESELRSESAGQ